MTHATRILALCLSAAALSAQPVLAARASSNSEQATVRSEARTKSADAQYCLIVEPNTGSRIAKKECRTRSEWAAEGVQLKR